MSPPPRLPPPINIVRRKRLVLWPRAELQAYYDKIGRVSYTDPVERLDDVRVVAFHDDDQVWIEVTTSQLSK